MREKRKSVVENVYVFFIPPEGIQLPEGKVENIGNGPHELSLGQKLTQGTIKIAGRNFKVMHISVTNK